MKKLLLFWIVCAMVGLVGCGDDGMAVVPDVGFDADVDGGGDSSLPPDGGDMDSSLPPDASMDGGETDGGETDGGETDGGETDGGDTDGGVADGGETDGGETDGGETDGGVADSGIMADSGTMDGGGADSSMPPTDAGPMPMACPEGSLGSMTGEGLVLGTTIGASDSASPSCIGFSEAPDMGYTFTAPMTAGYTFSTRGSALDTVLYVLDGTDCMGAELACDDDIGDGDFTSEVTIDMTVGQTVVVMVDAWSFGAGMFQINVEQAEAICDDGLDGDGDGDVDCADSDCDGTDACTESICDDGLDEDGDGLIDCADPDCDTSGLCFPCAASALVVGTNTGNNSMSTDDFDPSCGSSGGRDDVYTFTAPSAGTYTFATCGSSFDTLLWAIQGGTCADTPTTCNDDFCGVQSQLSVTMTAGETILVGVDGFASYTYGTYTVSVTGP